jgi:hypothetical protein
MTISKIVVSAALLILAGLASAGDEHQARIEVMVADGHGSDGIHFKIDSDDLGFNLEDMQEGETRSIIDEDGRSILITREAKGFKIDIDGKTIEMPLFDGGHEVMWLGDGDGVDVDVQIIGSMADANFYSTDVFDGVTILSSKPIDDVTREGIKSILTSSGHSGDVNFIDKESGPHGAHEVRIIKKEVVSEN